MGDPQGRGHRSSTAAQTTTTWADFLRSQADAILACDLIETVTLAGQRQYIHGCYEDPVAVAGAQRRIGEHLATWRKLRQLTAAQVADRAGISRYTVLRLESGEGVSMENLLGVARALGVLAASQATMKITKSGCGSR